MQSSSSTCSNRGNANTGITAGPASCDLTAKCQFYLSNGLYPSTRLLYGSAQRQFLGFCRQPDIPSDSSHPLLPASEQTLMRFCAHLADHVHHSSMKVYLSTVRSLNIDYSYPDPVTDCL